MAGTIIDMSRIKQLLQLKKAGVSNRQIARDLKMSRDKANEYVSRAENNPLGIDGLLKLDDPVVTSNFESTFFGKGKSTDFGKVKSTP